MIGNVAALESLTEYLLLQRMQNSSIGNHHTEYNVVAVRRAMTLPIVNPLFSIDRELRD